MEPPEPPPLVLLVCTNRRFGWDRPSCAGRGARKLLKALRAEAAARALPITITEAPCQGRCSRGPVVRLPNGELRFEVSRKQPGALLSEVSL